MTGDRTPQQVWGARGLGLLLALAGLAVFLVHRNVGGLVALAIGVVAAAFTWIASTRGSD